MNVENGVKLIFSKIFLFLAIYPFDKKETYLLCMKFEDETEVTFSQIILTNDIETVEIHFERPTKKTRYKSNLHLVSKLFILHTQLHVFLLLH